MGSPEKDSLSMAGDEVPAPPPPYSSVQNPPSYQQEDSSSSGSNRREKQTYGKFPASFNMYRVSTFGRLKVLGEHQDQPLYAVSFHSGFSGLPDVVLHDGPSDNSLHLATVNTKLYSPTSVIKLPPDGEETSYFSNKVGYGTHTFSVRVEDDDHLESFQCEQTFGVNDFLQRR
jgi:hypothetical protein